MPASRNRRRIPRRTWLQAAAASAVIVVCFLVVLVSPTARETVVALVTSPVVHAAVAGVVAMAVGYGVGLAALRRLLAVPRGITGTARAVLDEAIRMRSTFVLLMLLVACMPILPLLLDPAERLTYRVQFLVMWTLGGASLIISLLTVFLACGSICGDIASGRIHMSLTKPLARQEYLIGKWLGIVLYNLLLVALVGIGSYTMIRMLAAGPAADGADREAVQRQVLVARRAVPPTRDDPEAYAAAVNAAIDQRAKDDPEGFAADRSGARKRIRREFDRQWLTVTSDMVSTYVFRDMRTKGNTSADVQLQMDPRALNVDIDFSDVSFGMWLNDRPWPVQDGEAVTHILPSQARHVFDIPAAVVSESDDLRLRIANRNLVPPGETRATSITFPAGDGLQVLVRTGGFESNFLRCLMIMWLKLAVVAAVSVAAGAMFEFPSAVLAALVIYAASLGSDFFRDSLGIYNVVSETAWGQVAERMSYAAQYAAEGRGYDVFRMLLGFLTDAVLWILPSFSSDAAITHLATGIAIPWTVVATRFVLFGAVYPAAFGFLAWFVFDRRDLVKSGS
jgi:hypothetical protein